MGKLFERSREPGNWPRESELPNRIDFVEKEDGLMIVGT
jgi:hypothetical protein